jgi:hypothetical protein
MERKKRSPLAFCGIGCLGLFGVFVIVFTVAYSVTGHYMPSIPSQPAMPGFNALDYYAAAGAMLKANGGVRSVYGTRDASTISLADQKLLVGKNKAALARLRQGFGMPCRIPRVLSFTETFPYLSESRDIARLLSAEAEVKMAAGDYGGAFSSGIDGIHLGHDYLRGGVLIHALVGVAIQAIVQQPMVRAVDKLPADQADRLVERLQQIILTRVPNEQVIKEEHYSTLGSLARMPSSDFAKVMSPSDIGEGVNGDEPENVRAKSAFGSVVWHFTRDKTLRDLEGYYTAIEREAAKPPTERQPVPEPGGLARIFAPVFTNALTKLDDIDLRNRLLLCAAAVRSYRLKHGKLPSSLTDLGLDPKMLVDPYSGKDLVYRPGNSDYLLYSVGADGRDDGGVPADEGTVPAGPGDLGIRRFEAKPERKAHYRLVPHMKAHRLQPGAKPLQP